MSKEECDLCLSDIEKQSTELTIKEPLLQSKPTSVQDLTCITENCSYTLCNDCKDTYYKKFKNKNCPNCRNAIPHIEIFIASDTSSTSSSSPRSTSPRSRRSPHQPSGAIICKVIVYGIGGTALILTTATVSYYIGIIFIYPTKNESLSQIMMYQCLLGYLLLCAIFFILKNCCDICCK